MSGEKLDLYDANKGLLPRTGGPYLDEMEALKAEERRAVVEKRKPDLNNPGPYAGTVLVPKEYLRETDTDHSHAALSNNVAVVNKPVMSVSVSVEESKPDPTQVDFDNDMKKLELMKAKAELDALNAPVKTETSAETK